MANLSVRKLDEDVFSKLRMRAISMEEEVRKILKRAVTSPIKLGDTALQLFGETHGVELELSEHTPHKPFELML